MTTPYSIFSSYINEKQVSLIKQHIGTFSKMPNHQKLSLLEKALSEAQHDILQTLFIKTHADQQSIRNIIHNALCNGQPDEKSFNFLQSQLPIFTLENINEFTARAPITNLQLVLNHSLITPMIYENLLSAYIQLNKPEYAFMVLKNIQDKKVELSDKNLMSPLYSCFKAHNDSTNNFANDIANEIILITMKQQEKAFQSIYNHVKLDIHIKLNNNSKVLEDPGFKEFVIGCLIHADYAYLSETMPTSGIVNKRNRKI